MLTLGVTNIARAVVYIVHALLLDLGRQSFLKEFLVPRVHGAQGILKDLEGGKKREREIKLERLRPSELCSVQLNVAVPSKCLDGRHGVRET